MDIGLHVIIQVCRFELIQHSIYSPDLAPPDYFLIPRMTKEFSGPHFGSDDDVIAAVDHFLVVQCAASTKKGSVHCHWTESLNVGRDNVEK